METGIKIFSIAVIAILIGALIGILTGYPVMLLWNYVMPELFGLKAITFWQAWALAALASLLFKSTASSK